MVRAALRRVDTPTATVAELAKRYGFSELGHFAALYRTVFGETPSTTQGVRGSLTRGPRLPDMHSPRKHPYSIVSGPKSLLR